MIRAGGPARRPVTAEAVVCCARLLEERMSTLEQITRSTPGVRVDLEHELHEVAERAVAVLHPGGGASGVQHAAAIVRGLHTGEVSAEVELVECRSATCSRRRRGMLTHAGTSCEGCGCTLTRVLGALSAPECPAWCERHQADELSVTVHERVLVDLDDLRVWLEESRFPADGGAPVVEGPALAVGGDDGNAYLQASPAVREHLQRAVAAASGLVSPRS